MKKKYEKPYIKAEKFDVIQSVSSCNVHGITIGSNAGCAPPEGDSYEELDVYYGLPECFTGECEMDFNESGYGSYCYHTPTGSFVVLSS